MHVTVYWTGISCILHKGRGPVQSICDASLLLQAQEGVQGEQVDEHLSQLAALAESSLAGAMQCTHGPATCVPYPAPALLCSAECNALLSCRADSDRFSWQGIRA